MKKEIKKGLEYQKIEGWKCLKRLGIYSIWATQTKSILSCNYIHQYKFFDTPNEAYEYYKTYISK